MGSPPVAYLRFFRAGNPNVSDSPISVGRFDIHFYPKSMHYLTENVNLAVPIQVEGIEMRLSILTGTPYGVDPRKQLQP